MERSSKIFREIASAAHRVITSANAYADREGSWSVRDSHFQLEDEMRRVSVASACIADILDKSTGPEFDVRLRDWLTTEEPNRCRETLIWMEGMFQKKSWVSNLNVFQWGRAKAPTRDMVDKAIEHFNSRKGCFYFLSLDIWNNERNVQRQQDHAIQQEFDILGPSPPVGTEARTNTIVPDPAIHLGGHADRIIEEVSNVLDQSILVPDQLALNATIPDITVNEGRGPVGQTRQAMMSDEQQKKEKAKLDEIVKWLDGLNCAEKQDDTLLLRQPDTCKWLLDRMEYKKWRDGGKPFLWLRGKPGAGKSVLVSYVISSLETSLHQGEILVFFYCDFRSERSTSSAEALRSILSQLLRKLHGRTADSGNLLNDLVQAKERGGSTRNNTKALAEFASRAAMLAAQKPLVMIDALDECKDVAPLLQALNLLKDHVRLFVTSRPVHVITRELSCLPLVSMDDMEDELAADIELHVTRELDARHRLRDIDAVFKEEIRSVLCGKAGGMFRWIQCSIDTLDRCVTRKEVRSALNSLPEGLDETYERILLAIDINHREGKLARNALIWLVAALRPLRLSELTEGLSINLKTRSLDLDFGPIHNGVLLDVCSSLVTYNEKTDIVILSHFSVKEYLMGRLILMKLPRYSINREGAHVQLARSCMCYLTMYLNSPPSNIPKCKEPVLCDYVLHFAIDHFRYLGPRFKSILHDIKVLAHDLQQHSRLWNNLCRSATRDVDPATPVWPPSKHDLALYILVAYAPNSLLQAFLRHTPLRPKEGMNPLVYAAYFDKKVHARTLLSRGSSLNCRGWDINGFFQVLPIEVAVQAGHRNVVSLFLGEGCTVPPHIFTDLLSRPTLFFAPSSVSRMMLQTDGFAEATIHLLKDGHWKLADIFKTWSAEIYEIYKSYESYEDELHELVDILRRLIQVGNVCDFDILSSILNEDNLLLSQATLSILQLLAEHLKVHGCTATGCSLFHTVMECMVHEDDALDVTKAFINHGYNPFETGLFSQKTLLHIVVDCGFFSILRYLLSLGVSLSSNFLDDVLRSSRCQDESTILLVITFLGKNGDSIHGHAEIRDSLLHSALECLENEGTTLNVTKALVSYGCNPFKPSSSGKTLLHTAVERGFVTVTQYLLSLGIFPSPDLLLAVSGLRDRQKVVLMIIVLVGNGMNVHAHTETGDTMLSAVLRSSSHESCALEIAKVLVSCGCDPHTRGPSGETPLGIAVNRGFLSVGGYLLSLITSPSSESNPPYAVAPMTTVTHPVEIGTRAHVITTAGNPLSYVALQSFWDEDEGKALEITKAFIVHGGNLLKASSSGETPLHTAVKYGFVSVARYLLSTGIFLSCDLLHIALLYPNRNTPSMIVCLVENGANTATEDFALDTVLQVFWDEGCTLETMKILVDLGCDPLESNPSGESLLHIAVTRGFVSVTKYLLQFYISPPCSLLRVALQSFRNEDDVLEIAQFLASRGSNLLETGFSGETPLHTAIRRSFISVAQYLLSFGISPSPDLLHLALESVWSDDYALEIAKTLVSHGCDPLRASLTSGESPVHIAVRRGFKFLTRYLLSFNIPPTPDQLCTSVQNEHDRLEVVQFLVNHDCDLLGSNSSRESLLHIAINCDPVSVIGYLLSSNMLIPPSCGLLCAVLKSSMNPEQDVLKILKALVDRGCSPLAPSTDGETPFSIAVDRGLFDIARYLISFITSPSPVDMLHTVMSFRHGKSHILEFVKVLVNRGCDPFQPSTDGKIPICIAVNHGLVDVARYFLSSSPLPPDVLHAILWSLEYEGLESLEVVKVLVNHGCSPLQASASGETPLYIAIKKGFAAITRYLLSFGISSPPDSLHATWNMDHQWESDMLHTMLWSLEYEGLESLEVVKALVNRGCDPLQASASGETPLYIAIKKGFAAITRYLLSFGISSPPDSLHATWNMDHQWESDMLHTMLWSLEYEGLESLEVVKALVNRGCDPLQASASGETPLYIAVKKGFVAITRYLLSLGISPPPDLLDVAWNMDYACEPETVQMIVCLIENGVDVHSRTTAGDTVIHTALLSLQSAQGALQSAQLLVSHGCDPLEANSSGRTPLYIAVRRGFVSVVEYFLSLGALPSSDLLLVALLSHDRQKQLRILCWLEEKGNNIDTCAGAEDFTMLKFLVSQGCNPLDPDSRGKIPLCVAIEQGDLVTARILLFLCTPSSRPCDVLLVILKSKQHQRKLPTVHFLIDQGASVLEEVEDGGESALHVAISTIADDEVVQVVELLLNRGCDPTVPNSSGTTPVHAAVEQGRIAVVQFFLSQDVQLPHDILFTAIQSRCTLDQSTTKLEMTKLLVVSGCDIQARNAAGQTPLEAAQSEGHVDVVHYLRSALAAGGGEVYPMKRRARESFSDGVVNKGKSARREGQEYR